MFVTNRQVPSDRRGQSLSGTLIMLAVLGAFALSAVIVQPNLIHGRLLSKTAEHLPAPPGAPERRHLVEQLAALIASSAEVIAVHQRSDSRHEGIRHGGRGGGGSPFTEIVLRMSDERGSDFISPSEIAVISHSRILQTIKFYGLDMGSEGAPAPGRGSGGNEDVLLTRAEIAQPRFCDRWRLDPAIQPRLIASGVSDLAAQLRRDRNRDRATLLARLTWAGDSPDGEEEAMFAVEVFLRP